MQKYQDRVFSTAGQPIQGVLVTVYQHGTNTLATLYSDNGVTVIPNPVSTDVNGLFYFYVADGRYDIAFSGSAVASPLLLTDVEIADVTDGIMTLNDLSVTGTLTANVQNNSGRLTVQTGSSNGIYLKTTADVDAFTLTPNADAQTSVGYGITNAANNEWTWRVRKNGDQIGTGALTYPKINNIRYADQFAGATADVKINAAVTDLAGKSGIVDCRGFGDSTQTLAAHVQLGGTVFPGQSITLLIDPATRFICTMTDGGPAITVEGGSRIVAQGGTVSNPNGYFQPAASAIISNVILFRGLIAQNLVGGTLEGITIAGNTGATVTDALLGIQNQLQITHIKNVTVFAAGSINTVMLKIYSFGGGASSIGNVEFDNIQIDGWNAVGNRPVWIGGANSGSLTPVAAGAVSNIVFLGPSAITHPGLGLPIVTIEAQNGAGGVNPVGNVSFYGTQLECNDATAIGILVNGAENVNIFGCYGASSGVGGADLVKLVQPAGTSLDGIVVAGLDNQGGWTNTLNNTVTGTVMPFTTASRVVFYGYSYGNRLQHIVEGGPTAAYAGAIVAGTAPTVAANQVSLGGTTATTVGAAGGATAPPATPVGYMIVNIAGTDRKIPYYNT